MRRVLPVTLALMGLLSVPLAAEEKAPAPSGQTADAGQALRSSADRPTLPLRVQVVISRYQGERRVSSAPYSLLVTANGRKSSVHMGVEVPVPVGTFTSAPRSDASSAPPPAMPFTSFQYRNVGTSIECVVEPAEAGFYQLDLEVETSSVYPIDRSSPTTGETRPVMEGKPLFNSNSVRLSPLLRPGQHVEAVASTDPVSGDLIKIEVSLDLAK